MKIYKLPVIHEILVITSFVLTNSATFAILGLINKFFLGGRLTTLYCTYPVNVQYLKEITRPVYAPLFKWRPGIVGMFFLKGGGGITVVVCASEEEMEAPENRGRMQQLEEKLKRWTTLLGASQHTHGGRMPSILNRIGITSDSSESTIVATLCMLAVDKICRDYSLNSGTNAGISPCPIAVIGANGFIGQHATAMLGKRGHPVISIDGTGTKNLTDETFNSYHGKPLIILNLSRNGVLAEYVNLVWRGVYVLDDVYPEANVETRAFLKSNGAVYFHIAGIRARSFPNMIGAYKGVMPFCAVSFWQGKDWTLAQIGDELVLNGEGE